MGSSGWARKKKNRELGWSNGAESGAIALLRLCLLRRGLRKFFLDCLTRLLELPDMGPTASHQWALERFEGELWLQKWCWLARSSFLRRVGWSECRWCLGCVFEVRYGASGGIAQRF